MGELDVFWSSGWLCGTPNPIRDFSILHWIMNFSVEGLFPNWTKAVCLKCFLMPIVSSTLKMFPRHHIV